MKLNPEETGYETKNLEFSAFYYKDSSSIPADDDLKDFVIIDEEEETNG